MRLRKIIQDYFTFSKKERNGIVVLLMIVILIAIANQLIFLFEKPGEEDVEKFLAEVAEFKKQQAFGVKTTSLFEFDPNSIDSLALDSLQLPIQVKRNLLKLRMKGGRFYNPKDLRRLYGMNDSIYSEVEQYIRIVNQERKEYKQKSAPREIKFTSFNPNTMSENGWLRLGLTEKQAQRIIRYKQSLGGKFESKEQFKKTYGISNALMDSLLKYIQIETKQRVSEDHVIIESARYELNSADSVMLKSLPGIGSVLSKRIVKYRKLLGGFYSANQLVEVYGISPELYAKIENSLVVDTLLIQKMDVNFSSFKELSSHPYIGKELGREIINFRSKNGAIPELTVLLRERIINVDQYKKMRYYLGTKNN